MTYILAIDQGTTSSRTIVFDKDMKKREIRADVKDKITDTTNDGYRARVIGKAKADLR